MINQHNNCKMKKYLFRAGFNPQHIYNREEILQRDPFGDNSGNMVYAAGAMNVLSTKDTIIESSYYWPESGIDKCSEEDIERINSEYNAFILPLADAFRPGFVHKLDAYTNTIKKLNIPCIVIGVGLEAPYEPHIEEKRPFDHNVRAFVSEVLNHSTCLGLRGHITGDYLKRLGFIEDRDFQVIGCPSIFMHGTGIVYKEIPKSIEKYCTNTNKNWASKNASSFLVKTFSMFSNSFLIQQRYNEARDILTKPTLKADELYVFSRQMVSKLKKQDRIKYFTNVPNWQRFLEDADLFVGNRFHGTAMALLSGVPSIMLPLDSRTRELTEFHHIPSVPDKDINAKADIFDYLGSINMASFKNNHLAGLMNYRNFLKKNDLESILDEKLDWPLGTSPFETRLLQQKNEPDIVCYDAASIKTKAIRFFNEKRNTAARLKHKVISTLTGRK